MSECAPLFLQREDMSALYLQVLKKSRSVLTMKNLEISLLGSHV